LTTWRERINYSVGCASGVNDNVPPSYGGTDRLLNQGHASMESPAGRHSWFSSPPALWRGLDDPAALTVGGQDVREKQADWTGTQNQALEPLVKYE